MADRTALTSPLEKPELFARLDSFAKEHTSILMYVIVVLVIDLLQLWYTLVEYRTEYGSFSIDSVLRDGSVFFYTMSLIAVGTWHLYVAPRKRGKDFFVVLAMILCALAFFSIPPIYDRELLAIIKGVKDTDLPIPPHLYMKLQVVSGLTAAVYAITVVYWSERKPARRKLRRLIERV